MTDHPAPIASSQLVRRLAKPAALLLASAIAVAAGWLAMPPPSPAALAPVSRVTIAVPMQINSASLIVASAQALFQQAGVEVVSQPFLLGKDALKSLLDGQADLAVVADTPFLFALHGGADIAVLASLSQARRTLAIVARTDRGIHGVKDLAGKSVGLTLGTNFTYFLDAMLQVHGLESAQVTLRDLKVDAALSALKAGQIDAAVTYEPMLTTLRAEMGDRIQVFFGEDVYAFRFLLVGKPGYIDRHPQETQRVLQALIAANLSIRSDSATARRLVGEAVKVDAGVMAEAFNPEDCVVSLDPALLLALDDQTRWAMKRGLIRPGSVPDYLQVIKFKPLETVLPSAVKVTH